MKILLFGATGMVGQGVLLECMRDPGVEEVVTVGRTPTGVRDAKVREIVHREMTSYAGMEDSLVGFDACFFCLGVTSSGMTEADYMRVTFALTMAAAEALSRVHPGMVFAYVSGSGTDTSEKGWQMWARVKGRTENALLRLPLDAYMFRPGFIEPLDGIESRTPLYRWFYRIARPLLGVARMVAPGLMVTTRDLGRAMLWVARHGFEKRILEMKDIRRAAKESAEKDAERIE